MLVNTNLWPGPVNINWGPGTVNKICGLGPGLGTKQRARSQDIQIHVKDLLNTAKNSSKGSTSNTIQVALLTIYGGKAGIILK